MIRHHATGTDRKRSADEPTDDRSTIALDVLEEHGDSLPLADVADEVAVREFGRPLDEIPATEVLWIYDELYYEHVPALSRAGDVEYDQETDTVRRIESVRVDVAQTGK